MSLNLLAIDVGNTRTHLGVFQDGKLTTQRDLPNSDVAAIAAAAAELFAPIKEASEVGVYLASVNEPVAIKLDEALEKSLAREIIRIERDINVPIGRQLDKESIVGEDRLLAAAAAYDRLKQAVIVVDAGTAVTVDFIDGQGTFHGGVILPGAQMMLTAMHERTAQLPLITFAKPQEAIGHNTREAMLSGVFHGIRGAVREAVEKFAELYQGYPRVIATGGDAATLFEGYDLIEQIVPDLTLQGIAVTHRHATAD